MLRTFLMVSALVSVSAVTANASTVVIDDFDTTNFQVLGSPTLAAAPVNPATTSGPTADAIGGSRTITNERITPAGTGNAFGGQVQTVVTGGEAIVSLASGVEGTSLFLWDAFGAGLSADLVDGTNNSIALDILTVDLAGTMFAIIIDGVSVATEASVGTLNYDFADFGGVDFTNVNAIGLFISGPVAFDVTFDNIRALASPVSAVPLPATGFLLFGALGAVGALRSRRKS